MKPPIKYCLPHVSDLFLGLIVMTAGNKTASAFSRPERELFLWAVMMNRPEMSRLFWEESKVLKLGNVPVC